MNIYENDLWIRDIDCVTDILPELKDLEERNILITGASGLICSAVIYILIRYNETHEKKIQIYAAGRNESRIRDRFGNNCDKDYFHFVKYDSVSTDNRFDFCVDYIIHGAANSSPKGIMTEPVETMLGNIMGIRYLLDFARDCNAARVLYISSSEVYGKHNGKGMYREDDYGQINPLDVRSSYPTGKLAAETLCISYMEEYGVDSVIVRPGHIYGPTASSNDDHVSSVWAYDVAGFKDIVMKSDGAQIRSYVYSADCASAILKVLLCGERGRAYNVSNPDSVISIKEMADILCNAGGVKLHLESAENKEKKGFNPMSDSSLDSTQLSRLGWKGCFDARSGFSHTVEIIRSFMD